MENTAARKRKQVPEPASGKMQDMQECDNIQSKGY